MNRIINPYNVLAFYSSRTSESRQCPLYAPPAGLNWQVNLASVPSFSLDLVNNSTGDEIEIDTANVDQHCVSGGNTYLTYTGGGLASTPDEGLWQYRLTVDSAEYWSHVMCLENAFTTQSWEYNGGCVSPSGSDYDFTAFFSPSPPEGAQVNIEFDFGSGYVYGGSPSGTFDQDDIAWSDTTVKVRMNVYQGGSHFYRVYQIGLLTSTPCFASSITLIEEGGDGVNDHMCLEFSNANDMEDASLLYAQGYTQKLYFKPKFDFPEPVNETTFRENGEGRQSFESAAVLEQINLDFYPVPDYLHTVLALVRSHSSITLTSPIDGGTQTPVNPVFTPQVTENAICAAMRMTYEANRVFVKDCEEDMTLESC